MWRASSVSRKSCVQPPQASRLRAQIKVLTFTAAGERTAEEVLHALLALRLPDRLHVRARYPVVALAALVHALDPVTLALLRNPADSCGVRHRPLLSGCVRLRPVASCCVLLRPLLSDGAGACPAGTRPPDHGEWAASPRVRPWD